MAVDGKWSVVINSPMGAQKAELTFKAEGGVLTGTQAASQGTAQIANGKADGNNLSWSSAITSPLPMTLEFTGTVDGDKISGSMKAGSFGTFPFSGIRSA